MRQGFLPAVARAAVGYAFGHCLGNYLPSGYPKLLLSDNSDTPIVIGYVFMVIGWLIGLGVFNDLFNQMRGKRLVDYEFRNGADTGLARYFRFTLDHKVVGIQYLVGMV